MKLVSVTVASLLLAACSSENTSAPPPAPVDWRAFDAPHGHASAAAGPTARERAVAEAYARALATPGFAELGPRLAGDVHVAFPGMPDGRGREAVLKAHETLFGAFDRRAVAVTRLLRTDSETTVEWTMTGVQAQPWMGVPATGKPVAFPGVTLLFTKDDGTLSDVHVVFDVAVVKAQLGVGPKELLALPPSAPPTGSPAVVEQTGGPDEARGVQVARATLDALKKGDEAAYLDATTPDVTVQTSERAAPLHGRDELKAWFRAMHKSIGQLDTTVDNAWGVGPYVVLEYFVAGEQLAAIEGIPAQHDRVVRLSVVDVLEMHDGKIARAWRYENPAQITAQAP